MAIFVTLIGAFTCLVSLIGLLQTNRFMNLVRQIPDSTTLITIAIPIRIAAGLLLFFAANETRHPLVVQCLGIVIIFAALLVGALGKKGIKRFIQWWLARPLSVIRCWMVAAFAFGVYLIYVSV